MSRYVSKFSFTNEDGRRVFRHEQLVDDVILECVDCRSICAQEAPYSEHWRNRPHITLQIGAKEKLLSAELTHKQINSYILCDEHGNARTQEFLLEAGVDAIPFMLRFLFYQVHSLKINIGSYVYVRTRQELLYFQSSQLLIEHCFDIQASVDILLSTLLEKVRNYLWCKYELVLQECSIKRLKLEVQRIYEGVAQLPLQYRLKMETTMASSTANEDAYFTFKNNPYNCFLAGLKANLYCFQICLKTKELYVVPYILNSADVDNTTTFVINNDVTGEIRQLREIKNVPHFVRMLEQQDTELECEKCTERFMLKMAYVLHKRINCGQDFELLKFKDDFMEIYEHCIVLPRKYFGYAWYGIMH